MTGDDAVGGVGAVRAVDEVSAVVEVTDTEAVRGHTFDGSVSKVPGVDADVEQALVAVLDPLALIESVPGVGPGFRRAVPGDHHGADRSAWPLLTSWSAALLHAAGVRLADEAAKDLRNNGDDAVTEDGDWRFLDQLPRMTWKQDAVWRLQLIRALDELVADLAMGHT